MIPFATKNQLNQVEKHLEEKTQTPPNAKANEGFGYIHELQITDNYNDAEIPTGKLFVRLDTAEAVPTFQENNGTKEDTLAFLVEHLINILYYKFEREGEAGTETIYDTVHLYRESGLADVILRPAKFHVGRTDYYCINGIEDVTE